MWKSAWQRTAWGPQPQVPSGPTSAQETVMGLPFELDVPVAAVLAA
jgi:hypothetical protein